MFHAFQSSVVGEKHAFCEDYSMSAVIENGIVSVIADGIGSARNSIVGSKLVSETMLNYFTSNYNENLSKPKALKILKESYSAAYDVIKSRAEKENDDIYSYDTTLSCVVITSKYVIWAHCGDGAIFKVCNSGSMYKITTEQTGDFSGEVYAFLCGKKYWSFGSTSLDDSYAFLMVTDGVLEFFKFVNSNPENKFYYNLFGQLNKRNFDAQLCNEYISQLLKNKIICGVTKDDKTLSIVINDELQLTPSKKSPNPVVYLENEAIYLNYIDEEYNSEPIDLLHFNQNIAVKAENKSNLVSVYEYNESILKATMFYPIRDVEMVLDPGVGTKNAIHISQYIINRTIHNFHHLNNHIISIANDEPYITPVLDDTEFKYYTPENINVPDKENINENFLIKRLENYKNVQIDFFLFKNFFMIELNFIDKIEPELEFQLWSYSYLFADVFIKTMRTIRKNISVFPKPDKDYLIKLNFDSLTDEKL